MAGASRRWGSHSCSATTKADSNQLHPTDLGIRAPTRTTLILGTLIPSGLIHWGRATRRSPEICARRELFEETGFEVSDLELVAVLEPMPGLVQTLHYVYLAKQPRQIAAPTDAEEAADLVWVPLTETRELLAAGQLLGTATAVGMLTALALPAVNDQFPHAPREQVVAVPQAP